MHSPRAALWSFAFALLLPLASARAQTPADDARDGWLHLFDGKTTFGWVADDPKALSVENGELVLLRGKATYSVPFASFEAVGAEPKAGQGDLVSVVLKAPEGEPLRRKTVKLRPLGLKSIFNGKDLAGWKIFPGKKSTFAVEEGVLRVKDGPGDLQTEAKYGNFVLQLECKTHGKHLNSGVFFRCRDGEYQNGYEAQIRNQFTPEATQDYVIEEFDPETRKLIEKRKIKSTAFDFGTGAIYRRVPARLAVARDGEWFTMTIVAEGNHLATFVDGILTADWRDWRPLSDNARTGCRLEAGHISLQGHDPTTDLSFRNFRIASFGK